tara:strand:+ start:476 stop:937 length:462 start_codon:yes stop_codon:yes gene_type:complete
MIANILLTLSIFIVIVIVVFMLQNNSSFRKTSNFFNIEKNIKTVKEQQLENEEFLKSYENLEKKLNNTKKIDYDWNSNNTLESMILNPCLSDVNGRLTCYTASPWWYPNKKYNANDWKVKNYLQRYNPIYNYLGNVQDMYWDFESVRNQNNLF